MTTAMSARTTTWPTFGQYAFQIAASLTLVGTTTAALMLLEKTVSIDQVTMAYLIPVILAALRWGSISAVVSALAAIGAVAFFFYPPIYDFRVARAEHIVDLALFAFVALATSHLAATAQQAKARLQSEVLRKALIDSVSHELRTPLASIVGAASVLAAAPEVSSTPRLETLIKDLREASSRLNDLIQDLLDATRITTEGLQPRSEWIDPADVVNAAVERKRSLLNAHKVEIQVQNDLPFIKSDPGLIEKALGHLIENAAKYSSPGSEIRIAARAAAGSVQIAVHDQGAGFSTDEGTRIWERFYRSPQHRDDIVGFGLGLWIARSFVVACGGRVEAFSRGSGHGATLTLSFPAQQTGPEQGEQSDADE